MKYTLNEAIEIALKTWYPEGHNLRDDPHHPLGKLLGKWGKLLNDYMKSIYKPGYEFNPQDKLGYIWYYIRILCYQKDYMPLNHHSFASDDIDYIVACVAIILGKTIKSRDRHRFYFLDIPYSALIEIARRYNLTLDDLTASNWEKLKPDSERGEEWTRARVSEPITRRG